jgi:type VI secretion system protein VasJ
VQAERESGGGEWKHANDVKKTLFEAASFLRSQDPTDPTAYHLLRVVRWGGLSQAPAEQGSKKTRLPAVDKQVQVRLQNLMAANNYERVVQEAEDAFQRSPHHFWFNLQHVQITALEALGEPYEQVLEAVRLNLALLLHRFPTLTSLEFKDGTPFADPRERVWLEEEIVIRAKQAETASTDPVSQDARVDIVEQYNEARRILAQKGLPETIRYMQNGAEKDVAAKDKFLRKLFVASLCLDGGRPLIAQPILEDLEVEINKHDLQDWDPDLVIQVLKKLYICYDSIGAQLKNDDTIRTKKGVIFNRISKLDPIKALGLE